MGQTQDQKEKAQSISLVNKDSPQQKTSLAKIKSIKLQRFESFQSQVFSISLHKFQ